MIIYLLYINHIQIWPEIVISSHVHVQEWFRVFLFFMKNKNDEMGTKTITSCSIRRVGRPSGVRLRGNTFQAKPAFLAQCSLTVHI